MARMSITGAVLVILQSAFLSSVLGSPVMQQLEQDIVLQPPKIPGFTSAQNTSAHTSFKTIADDFIWASHTVLLAPANPSVSLALEDNVEYWGYWTFETRKPGDKSPQKGIVFHANLLKNKQNDKDVVFQYDEVVTGVDGTIPPITLCVDVLGYEQGDGKVGWSTHSDYVGQGIYEKIYSKHACYWRPYVNPGHGVILQNVMTGNCLDWSKPDLTMTPWDTNGDFGGSNAFRLWKIQNL